MLEGLFQPTHLLIIFGIALLVFGPKKLPELGKGIGEGIRGFKSAMKEPRELPTKSPSPITTPAIDDCHSLLWRVIWLPIWIAAVNQTGEYHSYKNIRRSVTTTPLGVEVFSRRCSHCFIDCLPCGN